MMRVGHLRMSEVPPAGPLTNFKNFFKGNLWRSKSILKFVDVGPQGIRTVIKNKEVIF